MKIAKIALMIMIGAIIPAATNPVNAQQAGKISQAQSGFACPSPVRGATARQRKAIRTLLPSGEAMNDPVQLNASIAGLKRLGLSKATVADHLIGAYCTTMARNSKLSDAEKTEDVRQFASQITPLVYNDEQVSDIALNVFLKPSVVDAVNIKAQASGVSVQQWLAKTIEAATQK
jgi:predicted HicB family RNase H-like nuclease